MEKIHVLYNPRAGKCTGEAAAKEIGKFFENDISFCDITKISDFGAFFSQLKAEDSVVVVGGDGTLTHFVDDVADIEIANTVYYYATGSGNDFLKDLNKNKGDKPFEINPYITSLPVMTVDSSETRFVNGVGGGLDAYACVEGNKAHAKGKNGNYVLSAVKGLLYDYKPTNARVTVDSEVYEFKNVWFASVMKGRYFGGGIMLAPQQDRTKEKLSTVIVHTAGRIRLLPIIPGAFKGKHVKYKKYVTIIEGDSVEIVFDRPVPLQVDGETLPEAKSFSVEKKKSKIFK